MSERANGRASGPVLTYRFSAVLNLCRSVFQSNKKTFPSEFLVNEFVDYGRLQTSQSASLKNAKCLGFLPCFRPLKVLELTAIWTWERRRRRRGEWIVIDSFPGLRLTDTTTTKTTTTTTTLALVYAQLRGSKSSRDQIFMRNSRDFR